MERSRFSLTSWPHHPGIFNKTALYWGQPIRTQKRTAPRPDSTCRFWSSARLTILPAKPRQESIAFVLAESGQASTGGSSRHKLVNEGPRGHQGSRPPTNFFLARSRECDRWRPKQQDRPCQRFCSTKMKKWRGLVTDTGLAPPNDGKARAPAGFLLALRACLRATGSPRDFFPFFLHPESSRIRMAIPWA